MEKLLVTVIGSALIIAIYWFFFMTGEQDGQKTERVIVSGGYKPKKILLPAGKTTNVVFLRTDKNSCLEEIVIPDFGIKEYLPLNEEVTLALTPPRPGIYDIHCGMNMFHGQIKTI